MKKNNLKELKSIALGGSLLVIGFVLAYVFGSEPIGGHRPNYDACIIDVEHHVVLVQKDGFLIQKDIPTYWFDTDCVSNVNKQFGE